jgi:glycosyltransferase involved in cell wall biosynthesis
MRAGIYIDRMDLRGGVQRVASNLCQGWVRRGWTVHLIVESADCTAFSVPPEVKFHRMSAHHKRRGIMGMWDNFSFVRSLSRLVRAERLESVLSISTVANVHLALADLPADVVRVGSEHAYLPHFPLPFHKEWFRRHTYPRLDAVVCPTREAADYISGTYPGTSGAWIPNWLTWPLPKGAGQHAVSLRRPGRKVFVACGRLDRLKGFSELITIFDGLKDLLPDWDLVIVGEGDQRPRLEAQVAKAGLGGRVALPGWIGDMDTVYRSADLFLFPSVSEGFALVLAEAMGCGLPCISYDCKVGPAEIIRNGVDGVLVPVGDQAAFSAAMLRLASQEEERRKFAENCLEVLERLSEASIQPLWVKVMSTQRQLPKHD